MKKILLICLLSMLCGSIFSCDDVISDTMYKEELESGLYDRSEWDNAKWNE